MVIGWLELFHRRYKWTQAELFNTDLDYLFDLYVVRCKLEEAPRLTPIDKAGIF